MLIRLMDERLSMQRGAVVSKGTSVFCPSL